MSKLKSNTHGHLVNTIGLRIVSNEYEEGSIVPDENSIEFDVSISKQVYRDAIKTLTTKGMLKPIQKKGTIVMGRQHWNFLDSDLLHWVLNSGVANSKESFVQFFQMRSIIEPNAAYLAAIHADKDNINSLENAIYKMKKALPNADVDADCNFHIEILKSTKNPFLNSFSPILNVYLKSSIISIARSKTAIKNHNIPIHEDIFLAIKYKNTATAKENMQKLIQNTSNAFYKIIDNNKNMF